MEYYSYRPVRPEAEVRLEKESAASLRYHVEFPSAIDTGNPENGRIKGLYYRSGSSEKAPLVTLVHGMGDYSVLPCKWLAGYLIKRGFACFVPYLTVHSKRLPATMKADYPYLSPEAWVDIYHVSVTDIRQIIDWAETRDEIDATRTAVAGISFGGIVSAITMAVEPRIRAGAFIVAGGNSFKMTRLSRTSGYRDRYRLSEEEYQAEQEQYYRYLDEVREKGYKNVVPPRESFLNDPLTFAHLLRDRPVMMINARRDRYIPTETAIELREAIGDPPIAWFDTGHVSLWWRYRRVRRELDLFLEKHLLGNG